MFSRILPIKFNRNGAFLIHLYLHLVILLSFKVTIVDIIINSKINLISLNFGPVNLIVLPVNHRFLYSL